MKKIVKQKKIQDVLYQRILNMFGSYPYTKAPRKTYTKRQKQLLRVREKAIDFVAKHTNNFREKEIRVTDALLKELQNLISK